MEIVEGGVEAQTEQALKNLKAVVEAGGSELGKVVKTTASRHFSNHVFHFANIALVGLSEIHE